MWCGGGGPRREESEGSVASAGDEEEWDRWSWKSEGSGRRLDRRAIERR